MAFHGDLALPARSGFGKAYVLCMSRFSLAKILDRRIQTREDARCGIRSTEIANSFVNHERQPSVGRNSAELNWQQRAVWRECGGGFKFARIPDKRSPRYDGDLHHLPPSAPRDPRAPG